MKHLVLGDQPTGVAHQDLDDVPLRGREADDLIAAADLLGGEVKW